MLNGLNQITTAGAASFSYGTWGDLLGDGTHTYTYVGIKDQLASVSGGGQSASLSYDALGRLWQTAGSATTRFAYDGSMITLEADGSGNILRRYLPGPDGTPLVWYEGSGTANRNFLLKDQQGSVIAIANSSGQLTQVNSYDPYGQPGTANTGRFQYAGYPWVPEVGLYNTGARAYSPTLGRFMQTDPIGYGDGMNWYAYVGGDPVNGTDPTGTEARDLTGDDEDGGGGAETGSMIPGHDTGASCSGSCAGFAGNLYHLGPTQLPEGDYDDLITGPYHADGQQTYDVYEYFSSTSINYTQQGMPQAIQVAANNMQPACVRAKNICLANKLQLSRGGLAPANDNAQGPFYSCALAYDACVAMQTVTGVAGAVGGVIFPDGTVVRFTPGSPPQVIPSPRIFTARPN